MNTNSYRLTTSGKSITFAQTLCLGIATVLFSTASSAAPPGENLYLTGPLFEPNSNQRVLENRGRIMNDGSLRDVTVEQALDAQFERKQSMRLTRIIRTHKTGARLRVAGGKIVVEDGGWRWIDNDT